MDFLRQYLPDFLGIFQLIFRLFLNGGWVLFIWAVVYMFYRAYKEEIEHQFISGIEWVFLEIRPPKENLTSTQAVESVFAQMHALHRSLTPMEVYVEGQFQQWYSLEMISMGGAVSFVLRVPKRYQHLVESAFYSQYPQAEIREIADYMGNFAYDPDNSDLEMFGVEWKLTNDSVIPIRTYTDFEHPSAEEKILDPLANLFQTLERMEPWEFFGVQLLIQPIQNDEVKKRVEKAIKKLTGEEEEHLGTFWDVVLAPLNWFAKFSYRKTFFTPAHGHAADDRKPKNNWLNMTEGEKERVSLVEKKFAKPMYQSKLRLLYVTPKEKYDKIRRVEIIGSLRHFSSGFFNTLKTDRRTWTKVGALISPGLEKPYLDWETKRRKRWFIKGYKNRSIYVGSPKFLLNVEEIATLFHFPISNAPVPSGVKTTDSKKVQAPSDLPIGEL